MIAGDGEYAYAYSYCGNDRMVRIDYVLRPVRAYEVLVPSSYRRPYGPASKPNMSSETRNAWSVTYCLGPAADDGYLARTRSESNLFQGLVASLALAQTQAQSLVQSPLV